MAKKNLDLTLMPEEVVVSKIYLLRNHKIMLDRDLAFLYGVSLVINDELGVSAAVEQASPPYSSPKERSD